MADFLDSLFADSPRSAALAYAVMAALGLLAFILMWQVFAFGPRRRRGLKRARRRLAEGAWQDALERVRKLRNRGLASAAWKKRFDEAESACLRVAARDALANNQFEEALGFFLRVAQLSGESETSARDAVQAAMLEEIRRLFSVTTHSDTKALHDLIGRALLVQSPCREASFWQALCFLRGGDADRAMEALQTARTGTANAMVLADGLGDLSSPRPSSVPHLAAHIEPPLYLGAILLRQGHAKDALKYLTEANRIDGNCPVVTLQLGAAMIAAGGDAPLAVRALQRALGPKGLALWEQEPRKAWVEGFPDGRSYIRKLASTYAFVCPIWGGDLNLLGQQGNLALAQGLYKTGAYQEAAELFGKVLQNGAPSLVVLRGLGLSLARLGKYDDAFKHLRIAHDMEEPHERVTAGYLALCGAKGKPTQPEDKARNILWALKVVTRFNAPGDREWVALISALFDEALAINETPGAGESTIPLSLDEQLYLCEHLWSVHQADAAAARAYHHLQATFPHALRPEYAWLYCRAAMQYDVPAAHALALFARTFADLGSARAFFAEQHWDWGELEITYLVRAAALEPGRFPAALGPEYPAVGENLLLDRSLKQEQREQLDAALATVEILAKLAPTSPRSLDRLAYLHHRLGNPDQAVQLLETWFTHHPHDPLPLVRFAILLHKRGLLAECQSKLHEAMTLCDGRRRARIAFIGARLTLQSALVRIPSSSNGSLSNGVAGFDAGLLAGAEHFLLQALADDPGHGDALWCLAAVRWLRGDTAGLAQQAPAMNPAVASDTRSHFFAALCRLAANDFDGALASSARIAADQPLTPTFNWPVETAYLSGLAHLGLGQHAAAAFALEKVARTEASPSTAPAQGLLGLIAFMDHNHEDAAKWWQGLHSKKRVAWKLGEALAQTVFLTALEAYERGSFQQAADKLRAAGKLGCRDRRLGTILVTALFKAGQALVYGKSQLVYSLVRDSVAGSEAPPRSGGLL